MKTKVIERNEVIATRVPPGDRWSLVEDPKKVIHKSLTDALEAYLGVTNFKGEYRLDPIGCKLYAIKTSEEEITPEPIKKFSKRINHRDADAVPRVSRKARDRINSLPIAAC